MPSYAPSTISNISTDVRLPPDFPMHLRQLSHHLTAVQARSQILPPHPQVVTRYDSSELQPSEDITFRPALLAANVHRFILSVLPIYATGVEELARLREWREPRRTAIWAVTYVFLWSSHAILPTFLAIVLAFILFPIPTAAVLFPPPSKLEPGLPESNLPHPPQPESDPDPDPGVGDDMALNSAVINTRDAACAVAHIPEQEIVVDLLAPTQKLPEIVSGSHIPQRSSTNSKIPPATSNTSFLPPKYRTPVEKYGGGVQRIAAGLADGHERLRNLFQGRYVEPNGVNKDQWVAPNIRLAWSVGPVLILSLILSPENLGRLFTFVIGVILFVVEPAQARFQWIAASVDPEQSLLRDVPTDRAWILFELRRIKTEGGIKALAGALRYLEAGSEALPVSGGEADQKLDGAPKPGSEVASVRSASSSSNSSSGPGKRIRLVSAARKVQRAAEIGNEFLNGQRTFTIDLSRIGRSIGAGVSELKKEETWWHSRTSSLPTPRKNSLSSTKASSSRKTDSTINAGEESDKWLGRFGCYYKKLPGELRIESDFLSFDSGIGIFNSTSKNNRTSFRVPINQIVSIKKSSGVGITGLWGGIDGLEVVSEEVLGLQETKEVKKKVYRFWNVSKRDLAFLCLVVMREWGVEEELNHSGWIAM